MHFLALKNAFFGVKKCIFWRKNSFGVKNAIFLA